MLKWEVSSEVCECKFISKVQISLRGPLASVLLHTDASKLYVSTFTVVILGCAMQPTSERVLTHFLRPLENFSPPPHNYIRNLSVVGFVLIFVFNYSLVHVLNRVVNDVSPIFHVLSSLMFLVHLNNLLIRLPW